MITKDEALKQAQDWLNQDWNTESPMSADNAVSAASGVICTLIEALSAPVQTNCRHCGGPDNVLCGGQCKQALAALVQEPGPSGDYLSDFQEGQWWLAELDAAVANGTPDQKRAVAVVRNLLATVAANTTPPAAQPAYQGNPAIAPTAKN